MPTEYNSVLTKCPFYDEETKNAIKCEGLFSKTCDHNFQVSTEKKKHKEKFCNRDYWSCPHFKNVKQKYP